MSIKILLDDSSNESFLSGSTISGTAVLCESIPKRKIVICFKGSGRVVRPDGPGTSANQVYIHETRVLYDTSGIDPAYRKGMLPDNSKFPFSFKVPYGIPSSYDGRYGSIKYSLDAKIFNHADVWRCSTSLSLKIINAVSIHLDPKLMQPASYDAITRKAAVFDPCRLYADSPRPIEMTVEIPKRSYLIENDPISVKIYVKNFSSSQWQISKLVARIVKQVTYTVGKYCHLDKEQLKLATTPIRSGFSTILFKLGAMFGQEMSPPTLRNSDIIQIEYLLHVSTVTPGINESDIDFTIPLFLGNTEAAPIVIENKLISIFPISHHQQQQQQQQQEQHSETTIHHNNDSTSNPIFIRWHLAEQGKQQQQQQSMRNDDSSSSANPIFTKWQLTEQQQQQQQQSETLMCNDDSSSSTNPIFNRWQLTEQQQHRQQQSETLTCMQ